MSETPAEKVTEIVQVLRDIRWSNDFKQLQHEMPTPHFDAVVAVAPEVILTLLDELDTLRAEVARLTTERDAFRREVTSWRWLHWGHPDASWACSCGHAYAAGFSECDECGTLRPSAKVPL